MAHRSVQGFRSLVTSPGEHRPGRVFVLQQEEIIPAAPGGGAGHLRASASRVFEVWGSADAPPGRADGNDGLGAGKQNNETLLGLAKVSLVPFSAFFGVGGSGSEGRSGDGSLATAVDGPVSVVDPFSGRAVGDLGVFFALGAASAVIALTASSGAHGQGIAGGTQTVCDAEVKDQVSTESLSREAPGETPALRGREKGERGGGEMHDGEGGDGAVGIAGSAAVPLLDDSVSGAYVERRLTGGNVCLPNHFIFDRVLPTMCGVCTVAENSLRRRIVQALNCFFFSVQYGQKRSCCLLGCIVIPAVDSLSVDSSSHHVATKTLLIARVCSNQPSAGGEVATTYYYHCTPKYTTGGVV